MKNIINKNLSYFIFVAMPITIAGYGYFFYFNNSIHTSFIFFNILYFVLLGLLVCVYVANRKINDKNFIRTSFVLIINIILYYLFYFVFKNQSNYWMLAEYVIFDLVYVFLFFVAVYYSFKVKKNNNNFYYFDLFFGYFFCS